MVIFPASASASQCPDQGPITNPFAPWGDDGNYFLSPGGDFDTEATPWTLAGDASAEPSPAGTGQALALGPGATATSPAICVTPDHTHGRMFGLAGGSDMLPRARVGVEVLASGGSTVEYVRAVRVREEWAPTRRFDLPEGLLGPDESGAPSEIQLRLTGLGPDTAVLDDVYIDPRARH